MGSENTTANKRVVLVTGADKEPGRAVVQRLLALHCPVHALVRSVDTRDPLFRHPLLHYSTVYLTRFGEHDAEEMIATVAPDAVIHCAELADVPYCEARPAQALVFNAVLTRLLARACASRGIHFTFVSSYYVFDGLCSSPYGYSEDDQVHPLTFYGVSKYQGEVAVQEECQERTSWTICRPSIQYGSTLACEQDRMTVQLSQLRQQQRVWALSDQYCSPTWTGDLAAMLVELTLRRQQGIYHTAGSSLIDHYTFICSLASLCGYRRDLILPVAYHQAKDANWQMPYAGLSIEKVATTLGLPPPTFKEGLLHWLALKRRYGGCLSVW